MDPLPDEIWIKGAIGHTRASRTYGMQVMLMWPSRRAFQGVVAMQKPQRQNPIGVGITNLPSDVGVLAFANFFSHRRPSSLKHI